jgi:SAM-dependent methyltransferase
VVAAEYEDLVRAAEATPIQGWDFGWMAGRAVGGEPSWSYPDLARDLLRRCRRVLDVDTGGGEMLATLQPPPGRTWATEGWPPNLEIARRRLNPLGVTVVATADAAFADAEFDLLLNRHGRLDAVESARVLAGGGTLLTQHVGSDDCAELNRALGAAPRRPAAIGGDLASATAALEAAGFAIADARQEWPVLTFRDIGAVVHHLRMVSWQVPDFSVERYDSALRRLHAQIRATGGFDVRTHRYLVRAVRSSASR